MKLIEILQNPSLYFHEFLNNDSFNNVINNDAEEQFIVTETASAIRTNVFDKILQKYNISELFDLANCYLGSSTEDQHFMFIHLIRKPVTSIKISLYRNSSHDYRDNDEYGEDRKFYIPKKYRLNYINYLNELDNWILNGNVPKCTKYICDFRSIDYSEFDKNVIYPNYYMFHNDDVRKLLCEEKLVNLDSVANVIETKMSDYVKVDSPIRILRTDVFPFYPFDIDAQTTYSYYKEDIVIKKGDIIKNKDNYFLVENEPEYDICVPFNWTIIRPFNINSEYLYIFLTSKIGRKINSSICEIEVDNKGKSKAHLIPFNKTPIVVPNKEDDFYINEFKKISNPNRKYYGYKTYNDDNKFQSVLKENCLERLKMNNNQLLLKQIDEDFRELDICYKNGAYKATLIMTGSILETFILDWLSEINDVDYFDGKEKVMITVKTKKGEKTFEAKLKNYLDLIKNKYYPNWNNEYDKAILIKDKRNLVHSKLFLKKSEEINSELCLKMIDYLKDVVQSRRVDI